MWQIHTNINASVQKIILIYHHLQFSNQHQSKFRQSSQSQFQLYWNLFWFHHWSHRWRTHLHTWYQVGYIIITSTLKVVHWHNYVNCMNAWKISNNVMLFTMHKKSKLWLVNVVFDQPCCLFQVFELLKPAPATPLTRRPISCHRCTHATALLVADRGGWSVG